MRTTLAVLTALLTVAATRPLLAQSAQVPVFRSGVEVMEVDVTVVTGDGVPVRDLRAPEFTVTVDGQPRRVVSAEFIDDAAAGGVKVDTPRDPYVSNNTDRRPGRLIMLAIDRNNIDTHTLRGATTALRQFVGTLAADDRLALITVPPPGPYIDFTTNHALIIDALPRFVGMDDPIPGRFNISPYEAVTFENRSNPIAIQRLLYRACGDTDPNDMSACDRDVEQEAMTIASHVRQYTSESVSALAALLKNLADVEGAKSLIILSQGLLIEGSQAEATALATLAAEARVNVNVMLFDSDIRSASQARISDTLAQDRDLREAGLEALASRSRGTLFRVVANPAYVFERLRSEIASHYMLGVEPSERDRDGKAHQIRVQVGRKGVQVRARRQVQYTRRTPNTWSRDLLMGRVLRSPAANTELPVRLSSYVFRDPAPDKVKIILAAEIDPESMEKDLDLAIGFAIFDESGGVVASGQERKIYSSNTDLPIKYDLTFAVDPGKYRVRLAVIDLAGKSGSVERDVVAFGMSNQDIALSDLILSPVREIREGSRGDLRPPVVLQVGDAQLATYTEIYTNKPGALDTAMVHFEIADSADGPTLQTGTLDMRERVDQTMRQAMGVVPLGALPPGRYIARAVISSDGKTIGKLSRPFEVVASTRAAAPAPATPAAASAAAAAPAATAVDSVNARATASGMTGILIAASPGAFRKEDLLTPEVLKAVFEVVDKNHPAAKAATARARSGKLEGTALMALEAGDQSAGSLLRGIELLMKGELNPAANQFGVALRNAADVPLASFYLGVCYAAAGKDKEAVAAWERARAAQLQLPNMELTVAEGWLRLGQSERALDPLRALLERQPQNDSVRKNLAIAQSNMGLHEQAYETVGSYLAKNPSDPDALLVALHALYQVHAEGKTLGSPEEDRTRAATYARAYEQAKGPHVALVGKWAEYLSR